MARMQPATPISSGAGGFSVEPDDVGPDFHLRTFARALMAVGLALCGLAVDLEAGDLVPATLQQRLQHELDRSNGASTVWGAVVTRADGRPVFATNAHLAFIPASNTKLFIGAMALDHLGPEARLSTPVRVHHPPDASGTLHSDLWIVGQGDPTLGTPSATDPRANGTSVAAGAGGAGETGSAWDRALLPWVARWKSRGLKRIEGDLVLCDAAVRVPEMGPGWDEEDRAEGYGAPVSAWVVHDNTFRLTAATIGPGATEVPFRIEPPLPSLSVDWRVVPGTNASHRIQYQRRSPGGPIEFRGRYAAGIPGWSAELAVANPAQNFGELLRRTLERQGVAVSGSIRVVHSLSEAPPLEWDRWISSPLNERLGLCLKPSQNLHAQLLLAEVGRRAEQAAGSKALSSSTSSSPRRHDEWGLTVLPAFLSRAGVAEGAVRLEEGSGLSRANRVTPAATVALLRFMAGHPQQRVWKDSLPVGGVDGTLRHRFKNGPARGRVRAKTGSLRGVHALGGYVTTAGGRELVFAIYANQAQGDSDARARMDRFVEILAGADSWDGEPIPTPGPRP